MKISKLPLISKLDHYLLIKFPHIWATRIHIFFIFSFVLGNILCIALSMAFPVGFNYCPKVKHLDILFGILLGIAIVIMIFWLRKQAKWRRSANSFSKGFLLFSCNLMCMIFLYLNIFVFYSTVIYKISNLVSNTDHESLTSGFAENSFRASNIYYNGVLNYKYNLSTVDTSQIKKMLKKYEVKSNVFGEKSRIMDIFTEQETDVVELQSGVSVVLATITFAKAFMLDNWWIDYFSNRTFIVLSVSFLMSYLLVFIYWFKEQRNLLFAFLWICISYGILLYLSTKIRDYEIVQERFFYYASTFFYLLIAIIAISFYSLKKKIAAIGIFLNFYFFSSLLILFSFIYYTFIEEIIFNQMFNWITGLLLLLSLFNSTWLLRRFYILPE